MIPDLNKLWSVFDPLHTNPVLGTAFALNWVLDVIDPADSIWFGIGAVILFALTIFVTGYHDLR